MFPPVYLVLHLEYVFPFCTLPVTKRVTPEGNFAFDLAYWNSCRVPSPTHGLQDGPRRSLRATCASARAYGHLKDEPFEFKDSVNQSLDFSLNFGRLQWIVAQQTFLLLMSVCVCCFMGFIRHRTTGRVRRHALCTAFYSFLHEPFDFQFSTQKELPYRHSRTNLTCRGRGNRMGHPTCAERGSTLGGRAVSLVLRLLFSASGAPTTRQVGQIIRSRCEFCANGRFRSPFLWPRAGDGVEPRAGGLPEMGILPKVRTGYECSIGVCLGFHSSVVKCLLFF